MAGNIYVGGGLSGNVLVASKISPAQARGRLKAGWSDDPDVQAMMRADLDRAAKALAEGDVVEMLRVYQSLKETTS